MGNKKIIDELCELLGVKNTKGITEKFGVANGTLSNLNNGKSWRGTAFGYELALSAIRRLSKAKRAEVAEERRLK